MTGRGFVKMTRGWTDHPIFDGEPYGQRAAWAWMIYEAGWQRRIAWIGGKSVPLERGQFTHSIRFMAKAWGWKEAKVRRFLEKLQGRRSSDALIDAATDAGQTVVTILNYAKYQAAAPTGDAPSDALSDGKPTQTKEITPSSKEEGAPPATFNPKEFIFGKSNGGCLHFLTENGVREKEARTVLGLWRSQFGDGAVIDAVAVASVKKVSAPVPFITKVLERRHGAHRTNVGPI